MTAHDISEFSDSEGGPFTMTIHDEIGRILATAGNFSTIQEACDWVVKLRRPVEWCEIMGSDGLPVLQHHRGSKENDWFEVFVSVLVA